MRIETSCYIDYKSDASKWKAQCITIGDFKLYFTYGKLLAFETPDVIYKTEKVFTNDRGVPSMTSSGHKYSIGGYRGTKSIKYVDDKLLKILICSQLLKQPFEEAKSNANFYCKRVH